jgi:hypothetical protein
MSASGDHICFIRVSLPSYLYQYAAGPGILYYDSFLTPDVAILPYG